MKKSWFVTGALTCILALNAGTAHAQPVGLHAAAQNAAAEFRNGLESGARIAVVAMEADSDRMSSYLIDEMIIALAGAGGFMVADRERLDRAAWESRFSTTQGADETAARSVGRLLGAQAIVIGALEPVGDYLRFRARVIDVETAAVLAAYDADVQNDRMIAFLRGEAHVHETAPPDEGQDPTRFWSVGFSVGTAFTEPLVTAALQSTLAPIRNSFIRVGSDLGLMTNAGDADYFSISMFAHYSFFLPLAVGGWHVGGGGSFTLEEHGLDGIVEARRVFAVDLVTGVNLINMFDVSYTLRTNFSTVFSSRVSVGFTHRFASRGGWNRRDL